MEAGFSLKTKDRMAGRRQAQKSFRTNHLAICGGVLHPSIVDQTQMKRLYNLLFTVFFCLSAPYYFLKMLRRGQWRQGFGQRFARYNSKIKQALTNRHVLWIHAVSVGEVNICTQLID